MPDEIMTEREALEAWQAGEITAARAMTATGATDVLELYAACEVHGVQTRFALLPAEEETVRALVEAVRSREP